MDLNEIAIFLRVVETGSFTRTAKALGLPKTTVSRKIANLEAALGVRLLHRTTRSLSPTDAGRRYYDACSEGLSRIDEANRVAGEARQVPSGTLRISAPTGFGGYFLDDVVTDFLKRYERTKIELILTNAHLNLVDERIDLAFRTGKLADSSLVARKLGPTERVFCASPRYIEAAGEPRRPSDLKDHDCIILGSSTEGATWTIEGPDRSETVAVKGRISVNDMQFAFRAAVAGLGIAALPEGMAARDIRAGRLQVLLPKSGMSRGGIYAVYPSNRHVSAAVTAFIELAARRLPQKMAALRGDAAL